MSDHRTGSIPVLGIEYAPIAQLDRVSDYESEGCRFDSYWVHYREIAQFGRALRSGRRGRRFKSDFPDIQAIRLGSFFLFVIISFKT